MPVLYFRHVSLSTSERVSSIWRNWEEEFSPLAKSITSAVFVQSVRAESAIFLGLTQTSTPTWQIKRVLKKLLCFEGEFLPTLTQKAARQEVSDY